MSCDECMPVFQAKSGPGPERQFHGGRSVTIMSLRIGMATSTARPIRAGRNEPETAGSPKRHSAPRRSRPRVTGALKPNNPKETNDRRPPRPNGRSPVLTGRPGASSLIAVTMPGSEVANAPKTTRAAAAGPADPPAEEEVDGADAGSTVPLIVLTTQVQSSMVHGSEVCGLTVNLTTYVVTNCATFPINPPQADKF